MILDDVSLNLEHGEIVVILGPSGAGKSTLLRAVAGFEPISAGEIRASGRLLSSASTMLAPEKRDIGVVVQSFALFPHLTAAQNVGFGLPKDDRQSVALEWLGRVNLADRGTSYPHELSGGEQQRVALARALARQPQIVLLDEAFSNLDQHLRSSVRREAKLLLRDSGASVLAVTHDPDEAMDLADRIVVIAGGQVVSDGAPHDLFWHPDNRVAARLLGEVNEVPGVIVNGLLETEFGDITAPVTMSEGSKAVALIRPSAIKLTADPSSKHMVADTRFVGGQSRLTITSGNGTQLSAIAMVDLEVGTHVSVDFMPEKIGWSGESD